MRDGIRRCYRWDASDGLVSLLYHRLVVLLKVIQIVSQRVASPDPNVDDIREVIEGLLSDVGIDSERVVLFGSRARGDYTEESDVDLLIVSPDFEGIRYPNRSQELYLEWPYDTLPAPEFICLTPGEFSEQAKSESSILNRIEEEGIRL